VFAADYLEPLDFHSAATSEKDSRTRAFLKVQDGCDYSCSYCTIPHARGASRSGSIQTVLREARELSAEGFREIVLSGVNVGDFGSGTSESFLDLARALDRDPEVTARLRISSIEPNLLKDEVIELVAGSSKWCPHFHVPLQSGSPKILKLMQRRYNRDLYTTRIEKIRMLLPDACIGADVIVGFPGESNREFEETVSYLTDLPISYLHVFTYSERPDTKAASMTDVVPMHVRRERNARLRELSERKSRVYYESQIGREAFAIFERGDGESETVLGYTENYIRVTMPRNMAGCAEVMRVRLSSLSDGAMVAEPLEVVSMSSRSELLPIL
jgi:threonylcarbamoyladenosine tRNA methylthiotransferase MtaB